MALVSQTIKNLIAGISQQAPILRFPEQLEHQENCWSSEADGLQKRPPTIHVANLGEAPAIDPLVHFANRDTNEQYTMIFTGAGVKVWDLQGNPKTVNYAAGALPYLTTGTPREHLKAVTVADYTFILNNTVEASLGTTRSPDVWATQGALINVKSGQYGRTYEVIINGESVATYETPDGSHASHSKQIDTNYIASQLVKRQIGTMQDPEDPFNPVPIPVYGGLEPAGFVVTKGEGWLYVTKPGTPITSVKTKDGFNNQAMFGFLKTAQKFSLLPAQAPEGFTIEITGEPGSRADNYYLAFDTGKNIWKEVIKPNLLIAYDPITMPHVLVREADGTFTFKGADWDLRDVGDDDSNPVPSFIGQRIRDVFFFRNRLGFTAGENTILSKSGEFFKFWITTAFEVLDTDYIDDAAPGDSVNTLYHAVPFNKNLLLFSETTQFVGRAEGVVTPKSFRIDRTTNFGCDTLAKPTGSGRNIYFTSSRQEYTSLMEYYTVQDVTDINNAQDVSGHVPSLIPNGVYSLVSNARESVILALTSGDPTRIYLYKYFFQQEVRVQSSWSFWEFNADVIGAGFIGSTLYLVLKRGTKIFLEKMLFTYNTKDLPQEPYRAFLDRKVISGIIPGDAYDTEKGTTEIDLESLYGAPIGPNETYGVLLPDGWYGTFSEVDYTTTGKVEVPGNLSHRQVTIGKVFKALWKPTTIMIKKDDGRGGIKADTEGRLQVKKYWVLFNETGFFKAIVKHDGKETYQYDWTSRILGALSNTLGVIPLETGKFEIPVQSLNTSCEITIESEAPTPFSFIGAGWEGNYNKRSRSV